MEYNQRENALRRVLLFSVCLQRPLPISFNVIVRYQRKADGSRLKVVHHLGKI